MVAVGGDAGLLSAGGGTQVNGVFVLFYFFLATRLCAFFALGRLVGKNASGSFQTETTGRRTAAHF